MPASRRCPKCHRLISGKRRYCAIHQAEYEAARGTTTQRGYGVAHQRLREQWKRRLEQGEQPICGKCLTPVTAQDTWDLGHTPDRSRWTGPEHASCNRSDGGSRGAQQARNGAREG